MKEVEHKIEIVIVDILVVIQKIIFKKFPDEKYLYVKMLTKAQATPNH